MVEVFPLWAVGVDVAEFNLLAKATDEKIESLTGSSKSPDFAFYINSFQTVSVFILSETGCLNLQSLEASKRQEV